MDTLYFMKYYLIPPLFMMGVTVLTILLPYIKPSGIDLTLTWLEKSHLFAILFVSGLIVWAIFWMTLVPGRHFRGPQAFPGFAPTYHGNGQEYYFATLAVVFISLWNYPNFSIAVYTSMPSIALVLNGISLSFCVYLFITGKRKPNLYDTYLLQNRFPTLYEFYRGAELHPTILGNRIDVKQFCIVRFGMMTWLVLTITFLHAGWQYKKELDYGHLTHTLLQSIYIFKTFSMERGFATILDATYDRAGYYLCWGGMVWVTCFFSWQSYLLTTHPTHLSWKFCTILFVLGLILILCNYQVLYQKMTTKKGQPFQVWGKPALLMKMKRGDNTSSYFLLSGWWGIARHINYLLEILLALMWSLPGYSMGIINFFYLGYLCIVLFHRISRDEEKCSLKYGKDCEKYCKRVPYRMIPYIF